MMLFGWSFGMLLFRGGQETQAGGFEGAGIMAEGQQDTNRASTLAFVDSAKFYANVLAREPRQLSERPTVHSGSQLQ
jgi:hypothetical protein